MSRMEWPKVLTSMLVGVGIGGALALLLAPKTGEEAREYLLDNIKDGKDAAAKKAQQWGRRVQKATARARESASEFVDNVKDALPE